MDGVYGLRVIVITGTPGTGKSSVAKKLAERLNATHIDLSQYIIEEGLYTGYDVDRASFIIDEEKVVERIRMLISKYGDIVIDTHFGEIIPREYVDKVIVLRTDPEELEKRLWMKGWWWEKIRENVEAEILSVCTHNAIDAFGEEKVYEVNTTSKTVDQVVDEILDILRGKAKPGLKYDWLSIKPINVLEKYLSPK